MFFVPLLLLALMFVLLMKTARSAICDLPSAHPPFSRVAALLSASSHGSSGAQKKRFSCAACFLLTSLVGDGCGGSDGGGRTADGRGHGVDFDGTCGFPYFPVPSYE